MLTSRTELKNVHHHGEQLSETAKHLQHRIRSSVKQLRDTYYQYHPEEPVEHGRAFGGKPTESIGAFAEYNLRSRHCPRSLGGLCTPCFYSRFPNSTAEGANPYLSFLVEQVDDIIDRFEESIAVRLSGKIYYNKAELRFKGKDPIACCITPVGSFFDEEEFPTVVRRHLISRLLEVSEKRQTDIILYVESHVIDFNRYIEKFATEDELSLFRKLHARIVFGFESRDLFVRNVLYGKELELDDFETAISRAKTAGFGAYAFTFVGLFPMSHAETVNDVARSFQYLKSLDVSPVVMFANIQEYTIADILLKSGRYRLINPITVLEITRMMLEEFGRVRKDGLDAWLIADPVGGPPEPSYHIFSDILTKNCCADIIYRLIKELRKDHEYSEFDAIYEQVSTCQLHKENLQIIYQQDSRSLEERTSEMLDYIESISSRYLKTLRNEELLFAKAHLLCEGAAVDNEAKQELSRIGITDGFIHSTNLLLDGRPVNACLMETFCKHPSCEISFRNNRFYLRAKPAQPEEQPELIGIIDFIRIPEWGTTIIDGYKVSDYLRPHSQNVISIWPNQRCAFGKLQCKFCSLPEDGVCLSPSTVVKMIEAALKFNPNYEIHLSGGVYKSVCENIEYYSNIARKIHEQHPNAKISLETIPTISRDGLEQYKRSGITQILMNLELANESVRKMWCPGKSSISRSRYFDAYAEAVQIFGKWNVGSVLLYGIEGVTSDDILSCVREFCKIGVYPVIMPFQPLSASPMFNQKPSNPEGFLRISEEVGRVVRSYCSDFIGCTFGCISCGACSIENSFTGTTIF